MTTPRQRPTDALAAIANQSSAVIPLRLLDLIDQFDQVANSEHLAQMNETSVRETYLNPLLEELGWDPRNRRGTTPAERDVILEDAIRVEGGTKAPDYGFIVGNRRQFFLEAKRPSVRIRDARGAALQLRRYCWSAGLPFGLLTDFQEFAIYDTRSVPVAEDNASVSRIAYFTYKDLPEQWPLLHAMFGKEEVRGGSLDRLANTARGPARARPID
ncbi:MAG: type IIL restriction-modification enzyme MmeI, partial [Mycobacteriales bacterium]